MTKKAWLAISIIAAIVMAAISAASAFMGGCDALLELANGNSMPMKCHWTFVACTFIGLIGVVIALAGITCKGKFGRRVTGIDYIACALVIACMPAPFGIGLCANAEMPCHTTALVVWALCVIAVVIGVIDIVKCKPKSEELPKRSL